MAHVHKLIVGRAVSNVVRVLGYTPSKPAAIVAVVVYLTCAVCFFWHVFKRRDWWALCLPIGSTGESTSKSIGATISLSGITYSNGSWVHSSCYAE